MTKKQIALPALLLFLVLGLTRCADRPSPVELVAVPVNTAFAGSAAPDSVRWACAGTASALAQFFAEKHLDFRQDLLKTVKGRLCHIFYEPTVPGFRASADNAAVTEIFANVNTLAFLAKRSEPAGDSLGVLTQVLRQSGKPLGVTLDLSVNPEQKQVDDALRFHFGDGSHRYRIHHDRHGDLDPWAQDLFKYGYAKGEQKILVTLRSYEGDAGNGGLLRPMLDSFQEKPYVRSKLAFEGGDLLFAKLPKQPDKLVMFYGTSAKPYWGQALTREEFGYVLQVEFGADDAVYFGDATPHVDYSLSLLPDGETALVAEPRCGDPRVADGVTEMLARLERTSSTQDLAQRQMVTDYVNQHCPGKPGECVKPERLPDLVEQEPALVRTWLRLGNTAQMRSTLAPRLREILRRQASGCDGERRELLQQKAELLRKMGFRVVRVPWLEGEPNAGSRWPGISYVNAAAIGDAIFLPELGLGQVERDWFDGIDKELPEPFRIVPTPAANLLLQNGGIHCVLAFGRAR